ncbi:uncharacterized protein LOC124672526 [Lolium rigidum]|uniref:uncharacterized protein LOC124672526 n=1 Tax=Lolium rigidum TaxID=89674 RepID=UPI001F5CB79B|nr:uncharacterized protein LOC124672526 [Lolium rigidum]
MDTLGVSTLKFRHAQIFFRVSILPLCIGRVTVPLTLLASHRFLPFVAGFLFVTHVAVPPWPASPPLHGSHRLQLYPPSLSRHLHLSLSTAAFLPAGIPSFFRGQTPPDFPTAICSTAAASPIFEASKHLATSFSLCASLHLNSQGVLESVHEIPVKSLSLESRQGAREFLDEVRLLLKVHQRNLVSLVSCCTSSPARAGHKIRATHTSQTLLATPTSSRTLRPRWTTGHELSKSTVNAGARIGCGGPFSPSRVEVWQDHFF